MELRHLRYFVAVAEDENMGRAAARLRVAQSALSRQLRDLERELGVQLFERLSRGIRLTEPGHVFLDHARRTLAAADDGARAARAAAEGEVGRLRVAPPDFGVRAAFVATALAMLRERRPRVAVELVAAPWTEHVEQLRERRIDVGFGIAGSPADYPPDVHAERVADEPLAWAMLPARHPLAARPSLTLAELSQVPMVLSQRAKIAALYDRITGALRRAGHEPRVVSAPDTFAAVAQLVAAGAGWCAVVEAAAVHPPPGTVAVAVPELRTEGALELDVLRRRHDPNPLAAAYVECVHEALRAADERG
jgi:LysR family transcriptional regulator, benzoate and cis,cis-muconate-responsive activator of ben and cat genes